MLVCNVDEIIIHGTTSKGKTFRPSDWSERLCGILSSFDKGNRLSYHEWVRPLLVENVRCVAVHKKLQEINPAMFRFLMDFAADNDLRVINCQTLIDEQETQQAQEAQQTDETNLSTEKHATQSASAHSHARNTEEGQLREIEAEETASAFAALSILRPTLTDVNRFVEQVNAQQRPQGYRLLGIFEEGKNNAVAVCGFRVAVNLVSGVYIHIDDVVTIPQSRGRGHAARLLSEVVEIARQAGITQIQINSNVGSDRNDARRLYFRHGFDITGHHFIRKV
ncbi:MAG: GNAT family N-acetyltransferase [Neisseria sp.]|uniref:GNAT family N-acetyltransferase n=1 Tax=Neisseria sp. TaxID=192066 RepID=UPI0026DC772A|nr:GNAT family N-acetyltransferase [Neisseria sp.]MDO4640997.1 GNAT family N-acetyltransferase [Neisseria sp.]